MSERKVLNKYYPPDFDVTKLPKLHLSRDRQFVIRIMAPFSMRCKTCGDYIYKGRKFNARQETVKNETYLGLRKYRFYIRCPKCLSEITFKTDPENTDYEMEEGATRNFQAYRFAEQEQERQRKEKEEEELNNPMKALENRTQESKKEMELIEKLEELKDINKRHAVIDHEKLIQDHLRVEQEQLARQEEEDEILIKSIFSKPADGYVKRLDDSDTDEDSKPSTSKVKPENNRKREATDILTEEPSTSFAAPIKKKVINASSGTVGFSSKLSPLSQLVKKKAPGVGGKQSVTPMSGLINSSTEKKTVYHVAPVNKQISAENDSADNQNGAKESQKPNSLSLLGGYDSSDSSNDSD